MPVTIHPDPVPLASVNTKQNARFNTPRELLLGAATNDIQPRCGEIFQSSFSTHALTSSPADRLASTDLSKTSVIKTPFNNGFVGTALTAYNGHHQLILRPDDIWITILTQFNLFVNARAEELRHLFVTHDGKKTLEVCASGTRYTVDFGSLAKQMTEKIQENIIDPELREWVMPDLSTTTNTDRVVCAVAMMATLQEYFEYRMSLMCGLPSVTLLGERGDWEAIYKKVDKLNEYGEETRKWHSLLKPVLARFVKSFDDPESEDIKSFWQTMVKDNRGGYLTSPYLSGWITSFCYFGKTGRVAGHEASGSAALGLDGVSYPFVNTDQVAPGIVDVPVILDDNGEKFDTFMVAGLVGAMVSDSVSDIAAKSNNHLGNLPVDANDIAHDGKKDTLQPMVGWWICENSGVTAKIIREQQNEQWRRKYNRRQ